MTKYSLLRTSAAVLAGILLNGVFQYGEEVYLKLPFFFDSFFTIVVGVFFGWLPGVLTGLGTNLFMELTHGFSGYYWPFAVVNMATGLIAGLMARNKAVFWTIPRQIALILTLTVVNALLGALVVVLVFGGMSGTLPDILVSALVLTGQDVVTSAFVARILINLVDKGLPVLVLFILYRYIWRYDAEDGDILPRESGSTSP